MDLESTKILSAALCMAIGSIAPAAIEGYVAGKAIDAMGRNPDLSEGLFPKMIVAMAICESTGIYCLVISLIILFVA